ncbi:MAG: FAD-dependent oxidoreductase [Nanoarchaeota archaeon]
MPIQRFDAVLESVRKDTPSVSTFRFRLLDGKDFEFKPGQFVNISLPGEGKRLFRPYSICSSPLEKGMLEFCITRVPQGVVSNAIHTMQPGTPVGIAGPLGIFFLKEPVEQDILCIATGSGVGPMRSMITYALAKGMQKEIWLVLGVRKEFDIIYKEEFLALARKHSNFHLLVTLSRPEPGWQGESGYVQTKLDRFFSKKEELDVYICGLKDMVMQACQLLLQNGFPKEHVHFERYN